MRTRSSGTSECRWASATTSARCRCARVERRGRSAHLQGAEHVAERRGVGVDGRLRTAELEVVRPRGARDDRREERLIGLVDRLGAGNRRGVPAADGDEGGFLPGELGLVDLGDVARLLAIGLLELAEPAIEVVVDAARALR